MRSVWSGSSGLQVGRGRARRAGRSRRLLAAPLAAVLLAGSLAACSGDPEEPAVPAAPSDSGAATPAGPLTLGVHGAPEELAAWQRVVSGWSPEEPGTEVELLEDRAEGTLESEIAAGEVPDVFLATADQLPELLEADLVRPLGEPLDERGVDFGDGYSRDALQAWSAEDDLQCMPWGISPQVLYVNTDLVDLERMERRGLPVPSSPTEWDFEQFAAAVSFATRPRRGVRGVHVEATLEGLRPWVLAGGGSVFDDEEPPTSLDLSSEESREALETLLTLLRAPQVTPTPEELEQTSAVELFAQGRLAVLPGERELVPRLRQVQGLDFDVRQLPRIDGSATTGTVTGLCVSSAADPEAAVDLLLHLLEPASVGAITREGYLVPAELAVLASDDFRQPGRQPESPQAYLDAVRDIVPPPTLPDDVRAELEATVEPALRSMVYDAVIELEELTEAVDESSRPVLDPDYEEPSEDASGSAG